ncbi:hypothetical protein [Paucibacter sp. XJ19-41]|uniref:hypothetical protein n=1 Tax=Paucibacter sp. XJ19-41 TaxID=2927824 RepID=UPI00234AC70C|nr:hypothetical protein [Paucibacter sp. XJ19-41]MDC6166600.1 hypothetical protein [Paucibacter sp. XJ19-41]
MASIAMSVFLDSELGAVSDLPHAGSALEHPLVFDSTAREFREFEMQGKVEILHERQRRVGDETLIDHLRFRRLQ